MSPDPYNNPDDFIDPPDRLPQDPTPTEIYHACEKIRSTWTEKMESLRNKLATAKARRRAKYLGKTRKAAVDTMRKLRE